VPGAIADNAVVRAAFGAVAQIGVAVPYGSPARSQNSGARSTEVGQASRRTGPLGKL
jgi:hypothetical protein